MKMKSKNFSLGRFSENNEDIVLNELHALL